VPIPADAPPPVVVEIAPPDSAQDLKRALLDACTRATQSTECIESTVERTESPPEPEDDGKPPSVVAIVSWRDEWHVKLDVALRREQRWVAREISFDEHDVPEERWRAVGLVIGTLGSVMTREAAPAPEPAPPARFLEPPPPPPPQKPPPPPPPPKPPPPPPPRASIRGSFFAGPGLQYKPLRLGADLRGTFAIVKRSLHVSIGFAYAESAASTDAAHTSFADATVGLLYAREPVRRLFAEAHVDALAERLAASVPLDVSASPGTGERVTLGVDLGAGLLYYVLDPIGFFVDGTLRWNAGTTEIRVGEQSYGTTPVFGLNLRIGVAARF